MDKPFFGKRILVVEDEKLLLNEYATRLERNGFIVRKADKLSAAHEAIRRMTFHLAWVDLTLEGKDDRKGYIVIDELKSLDEGTKIAVVTQHSRSIDEALRAVQKAGAHTFIPKSLATRSSFPQCLEKLQELLTHCKVDKNSDIFEAQEELVTIQSEGIIIGNIIAKFSGRIDGASLWKSLLLAGYNAIKPVRRHKEKTFDWDDRSRAFRSPYWSKRFGCSVEMILGNHPKANANSVIFEQNKGVPLIIRKTRISRDDFEE